MMVYLLRSSVDLYVYLVYDYYPHDLCGLLYTPTVEFSEASCKGIVKNLLEACKYLHAEGYIHRDIKRIFETRLIVSVKHSFQQECNFETRRFWSGQNNMCKPSIYKQCRDNMV